MTVVLHIYYTMKSASSYTRYTIWDSNRGKTRATIESIYSILVTLLGIVIEVRLMQPLKALFPILVTPLPIVTEVRPVQL